MKKLNITKKQFGESKYFTNKYGTLKYVSENGKFYRTSKGQVLKFLKESSTITYINEVKFRNKLEDVFTSAISDLDDDNRKLYAEDLLDEYIDGVVEDTHKSMNKYLHSRSTSMNGNFADVELNYRRDFNGADFRDVVEKIDNGMEDSETKQFRDWLVDWYFKAFGTYNLKYNFMEFVSEFTADYEDDTYDESSSVECDRCGKEVHDDDVEIVGDEVLCSRCRGKRFWNETNKIVKEGAGAGYDITVSEIEIDKIVSVKLGDDKGSYAEFEATIKPCYAWVTAEGYYDVFCQDETVGIDGGTIRGEVFDIDYFESEEEALEYAKSELEGRLIDIKTMYGGGWMHQYLPEDGDITFKGDLKNTDYYNISAINIKSKELSDVVNSGYDNVGSDDEDTIDESTYDLIPTNGRKSFGGKAKVIQVSGDKYLMSYNTLVAGIVGGNLERYTDFYSSTTRNHIQSFLDSEGIEKSVKEFYGLPMSNPPREVSMYCESIMDGLKEIGRSMKQGAINAGQKAKTAVKRGLKKIGDVIKGPFRKGDHVTISGGDGESVDATITDYDIGGGKYEVMLQKNYDE